MPLVSVTPDAKNLTLTVIGEYPVSVDRLWQAWADPRQLERFWGPPQWPATFTRHDMTVGGRSEYHMTGPNGEISRGFWEIVAVEPPTLFEVRDGFADDEGAENQELPGSGMRITFEPTEGGARFTSVSTFASVEAMEQLIAMGMVQGITAAMGQLDAVLAT